LLHLLLQLSLLLLLLLLLGLLPLPFLLALLLLLLLLLLLPNVLWQRRWNRMVSRVDYNVLLLVRGCLPPLLPFVRMHPGYDRASCCCCCCIG
jgi:hypothetical protein